jgi:hypothetical protein
MEGEKDLLNEVFLLKQESRLNSTLFDMLLSIEKLAHRHFQEYAQYILGLLAFDAREAQYMRRQRSENCHDISRPLDKTCRPEGSCSS